MINLHKKLMIEQLDNKIREFTSIEKDIVPTEGWIKAIRTSLNISLLQFARMLKKSSPTAKAIEERESNGSITINKLREVGEILNLRLVYGFVPKNGSLEKMIEYRANEIAKNIVMKTSHTMKLEDQEITDERLQKSIKDKAEKIKQEMPKYLWD